jgi:tetratricopeptide (TPR) repeat protein
LISQGELDGGLEHAERAVELDLGNADAHFKLGLACLLMERHERAIVELEVALLLQPACAEAHRKLAEAYLAIGRTRAAREHALSVPKSKRK